MKRLVLFFGIYSLFLLLSVNVYSQDFLKVDKIVIDAGHGGHDPGTSGKISKEKDIALIIALKFGKYIEENFPEVKVIYTRKTDKFIELYRRAQIANENDADLFISIHCNGVKSSSPFGTETFVMGLNKSAANLEVARKENASILMEDNYSAQYDGYDPNSPEAYIIFSMFQNAYLDQSLNIASKVQYQFRERVNRKDRGVKQDGFLVLYRTAMPGILIEAGFLSNAEEEKFLNSEQGQTYIASAIYRAFKAYKTEYESHTKASSLIVTDKSDEGETEIPLADTISNNDDGIVFMVQFFSSEKNIPINSSCFQNLSGVQKYFSNGQYKFTVGKTKSLDEASKKKKQMRKQGFRDAFVIAFNKGERVKVNEAVKLLKQ